MISLQEVAEHDQLPTANWTTTARNDCRLRCHYHCRQTDIRVCCSHQHPPTGEFDIHIDCKHKMPLSDIARVFLVIVLEGVVAPLLRALNVPISLYPIGFSAELDAEIEEWLEKSSRGKHGSLFPTSARPRGMSAYLTHHLRIDSCRLHEMHPSWQVWRQSCSVRLGGSCEPGTHFCRLCR